MPFPIAPTPLIHILLHTGLQWASLTSLALQIMNVMEDGVASVLHPFIFSKFPHPLFFLSFPYSVPLLVLSLSPSPPPTFHSLSSLPGNRA